MKRFFQACAIGTALLLGGTGCMPAGTTAPDYSNMNLVQLEEPANGTDMAVVDTDLGTFKFVFYEEYAPQAVANFKALVQDGFYDNCPIYSVAAESKIFTAGCSDDEGYTGVVMKDGKRSEAEEDKLPMETNTDLWHFTGAVSIFGDTKGAMSSTVLGDSRFFVVGYSKPTADMAEELDVYHYPDEVIDTYKEVGGQPIYTGAYSVFGQVVEGYDVVMDIIAVNTENEDGYSTGVPTEELKIRHVALTTYDADEVEYESPLQVAQRLAQIPEEEEDDSAVGEEMEAYYAMLNENKD